jgi:hypothetical protein
VAQEEVEKLRTELVEQIQEQEDLIKNQSKITKDLSRISSSGTGLMDAISEHVMSEGFTKKMR